MTDATMVPLSVVVGVVGPVLSAMVAAVVWLAKQLLASNEKVVEAMRAGMAAKETSDEKNRLALGEQTKAIVANTKSSEDQTAALRDLKTTVASQTTAIDRINESVTGIIKDALARRSSSQSTPAVKATP
jgi:uncharacterized coiled-coil protein SlyX